jgi:hypothetical protein
MWMRGISFLRRLQTSGMADRKPAYDMGQIHARFKTVDHGFHLF